MMLLIKLLAADVGLPGLTATVGRRRLKPSINPLLLYSLIKISQIIFSAP
jgi:hypothetical protein